MSMMNKLNRILETKNDIKAAIIEKGVSVTNEPFSAYGDKIRDIVQGSIVKGDIVLSATSASVQEGQSTTLTIQLDSAPNVAQEVLITSDNTNVTVSPSSVSFDSSTYNVPKTITLTSLDDTNFTTDTYTISFSCEGVETKTFTLEVLDKGEPSLPIDTVMDLGDYLYYNGTAGANDSRFRTKNMISVTSRDLVIQRVANDYAYVIRQYDSNKNFIAKSADQTNFTGTTNTSWCVSDGTFTLESNTAYYHIVVTPYVGYTGKVTSVTGGLNINSNYMKFNLVIPVIGDIVTSISSMSIQEDGSTQSFTVKLSKAPTSNQIVKVDVKYPGLTLSTKTLTFTPTDWNTEQIVSVTCKMDTNAANSDNLIVVYGTNVKAVFIAVNTIDTNVTQTQPVTDSLVFDLDVRYKSGTPTMKDSVGNVQCSVVTNQTTDTTVTNTSQGVVLNGTSVKIPSSPTNYSITNAFTLEFGFVGFPGFLLNSASSPFFGFSADYVNRVQTNSSTINFDYGLKPTFNNGEFYTITVTVNAAQNKLTYYLNGEYLFEVVKTEDYSARISSLFTQDTFFNGRGGIYAYTPANCTFSYLKIHKRELSLFEVYENNRLYAKLMSFSFSPNDLYVLPGESLYLHKYVSPTLLTSATNVSYSVANTNVADVQNGFVVGKTNGTTTITATATRGTETATYTSNVYVGQRIPKQTPVKYRPTETEILWNVDIPTLQVGDTYALAATIMPYRYNYDNLVKFTSSNESVATVEYGVLEALKTGTTTITASNMSGTLTTSQTVTVIAKQTTTVTEAQTLRITMPYNGLIGNRTFGRTASVSNTTTIQKIINDAIASGYKRIVFPANEHFIVTPEVDLVPQSEYGSSIKTVKPYQITITATDLELDLNGSTIETEESYWTAYDYSTTGQSIRNGYNMWYIDKNSKNVKMRNGKLSGERYTMKLAYLQASEACNTIKIEGQDCGLEDMTVGNSPGFNCMPELGQRVVHGGIHWQNFEVGDIVYTTGAKDTTPKTGVYRTITPLDVKNVRVEKYFHLGLVYGYSGYTHLTSRIYDVYWYDASMNLISKRRGCKQFYPYEFPTTQPSYAHFVVYQDSLPTSGAVDSGGTVVQLCEIKTGQYARRCTFENSYSTGLAGGMSRGIIEDCLFRGNGGRTPSCDVDFEDFFERMVGNVFRRNRLESKANNLLVCGGQDTVITNNIFPNGTNAFYPRAMGNRIIRNTFINTKFMSQGCQTDSVFAENDLIQSALPLFAEKNHEALNHTVDVWYKTHIFQKGFTYVPTTGITSYPTVKVTQGRTVRLNSSVVPSNASVQAIRYVSNDTAKATVANGVLTGVATGTTTLTSISSDGCYRTTTNVEVVTVPTASSISGVTDSTLTIGGTRQLAPTVNPTDVVDKTVTYVSSDTNVATVSATGLVTAVNSGTTIITVTSVDNPYVVTRCVVTVNAPTVSVTGVTLDQTTKTMNVNDTLQLTATVSPTNATNKAVTWSSSDTNIATVTQTGLVTAKATGGTTITVTTSDGGKTAVCTLTIGTPPATHVTDQLAMYYNFASYPNGYTGVVSDLSGNNITPTLNGQSSSTTGRNGFVNGTFMINTHKTTGSESYIVIPNHASFRNYPFTLEFYGQLRRRYNPYATDGTLTYETTAQTGVYLFNTRTLSGTTGNGYHFEYLEDSSFKINGNLSQPLVTIPTTVKVGNPTQAADMVHIVFVLGSNYQCMYVNGQLVSSTTQTGTSITASDRSLRMDGSANVKLVRVYSKALSDFEVLQNYNSLT